MSSSIGSAPQPSSLRRDASDIILERRDRLVRHFLDRSSHRSGFEMMDDEGTSIGTTGTFRAPAVARRFINRDFRANKSNRSVDNVMEFFKLSVTSVLTDDGLPVNERTSLRGKTITEDKEDSGLDDLGFPTSASEEISSETKDSESFANFMEIWIGKPISYLLVFAPFAVISHYKGWGPQWIFWLNFLTMVPLASILGDFT